VYYLLAVTFVTTFGYCSSGILCTVTLVGIGFPTYLKSPPEMLKQGFADWMLLLTLS